MKEQTVTVPVISEVFRNEIEREINLETKIPVYDSDISRIIRTQANAYAESTDFSDGKIIVSGRVVFKLLYECENSPQPRFFCTAYPFEVDFTPKSFFYPDGYAKIFAECLKPDCRALQNGVLFRCLLKLSGVISARENVAVLSEKTDPDTYIKTAAFTRRLPLKAECRAFSFNGEIMSGLPVANVITSSMRVYGVKCAATDSGVKITASACFNAVCDAEDGGGRFTVNKTFPVSYEFDGGEIHGDFYEALCECEIPKVEISSDEYGENKRILISADMRFKLECSEEICTDTAADAFNTERENELKIKNINYVSLEICEDRTFTVDRLINTGEKVLTDICETTAFVDITSTEGDEKGIRVRGNIYFSVLGGTDTGLTCVNEAVPFEEVFPIKADLPDAVYFSTAELSEANSTAVSADILSVRGVFGIRIYGFATKSIPAVCELILSDEKKERLQSDICVTYFYPDAGETLWSIAKQYYVNPEKLSKLNEKAFDAQGNIREKLIKIVR